MAANLHALPDPSAHRLTPSGVLLWRSPSSVQFEIGDDRVIVDGVSGPDVRQLLAEPQAVPDPAASMRKLRSHLRDRGFLWPDDDEFVPPRPRLATELTALSTRFGQGAAELLAARGRRIVAVQGVGRSGSLVAALLAAAGVGRVYLVDRSTTRLAHAIPGGVRSADEGRPLADAAATAIAEVAPEVDVTPLPVDEVPDLVVLAVDRPVESDVRDGLHARDAAHLQVSVRPSAGVVGPLVVPGLSSCLACADLHRRDRDDAWSALAAQLTLPPRHLRSGELAMCTAISGIAVGQALAFLDGEVPTTFEATLELHPPDWRVRRRTWLAHPDCTCMIA